MSLPSDRSHPSDSAPAAVVTSTSLSAFGGSSGPKTAAGKAAASRNATTHGVFSGVSVLPGVENEDDWQAHLSGFLRGPAPVNSQPHSRLPVSRKAYCESRSSQ